MENHAIQEMQDRSAIEEVRHRYSQALDHQDWELFSRLFSDTVQTDFSDFGVPPQTFSKEDLVDNFKHNLSRPGLKTQHVFSSFRIDVTGDHATSVSNFVGHHFLADMEDGDEFTLRAEYTDTLLKAGKHWLICGIVFKLFYATGNPKLLGG